MGRACRYSGGGLLAFGHSAEVAKFLITKTKTVSRSESRNLLEVLDQMGFQSLRHPGEIVMRAAQRFRKNAVNEAKFAQLPGGDFQGLSGARGGGPVLPKDGGATLRTDDGVICVFEHQYPVRHADAQGASGTAFTDHHRDNWNMKKHHFAKVDRNSF